MALPSITFSGTLGQIQQQVLDFLGLTQQQYTDALAGTAHVPAPAQPAAPQTPAEKTAARALPVGAPEGSKWIETAGTPELEGPNGEVLTVDWLSPPPYRVIPNPPPNNDALAQAADAATAAMKKSMGLG